MSDPNSGAAYAKLGQLVFENINEQSKEFLLYVEIEDGSIASSVFYRADDKVVYRECTSDIIEYIYDIWLAESAPNRWSGLLLKTASDRFSVKMLFASDFDDEEHYFDRSYRVAEQEFGISEFDFSKVPPV